MVPLVYFAFAALAFGVKSKNHCQDQCQEAYPMGSKQASPRCATLACELFLKATATLWAQRLLPLLQRI